MSSQTLRSLIDGGPAVWRKHDHRSLAKALELSGDHAAIDLAELITAVAKWIREGARSTPDEDAQTLDWMRSEFEMFQRRLEPESIAQMCAKLESFPEILQVLAVLANGEITRRKMQSVLAAATQKLSITVPLVAPDGDERNEWVRRLRLLLTYQAMTESADLLTTSLDAAPEWLLRGMFETLGLLQHYRSLLPNLVAALTRASNLALPAAIAHALAETRPLQLGDLIENIARLASTVEKPRIPRVAISQTGAVRLLGAVQGALATRGTETIREHFRCFVESCKDHAVDQQQLLCAYLSAAPGNHEEVFDFLSHYSEEPRGSALPNHGQPVVTTWISSSMRSSSVHYSGPTRQGLPPPDFDVQPIFDKLENGVAIDLIKKQSNAEFSLEYMLRFSRRMDFDAIAQAICNDPSCVARWEFAQGTHAVVVWDRMDQLALRSTTMKALWRRLQPELLRRLPTNHMKHRLLLLPEELQEPSRTLVEGRVAACSDIAELAELATVVSEIAHGDRVRILELADAQRFVPPAHQNEEARKSWLVAMTHISFRAPELARRIVERLPPSQVGGLAASDFFSVDSFDDAAWVGRRLALEVKLVAYWASSEILGPQEALTSHLSRDFWMFFWTGFREGTEASAQWLDLVADVAPELVPTYAASLLAHAFAKSDEYYNQSFAVVAPWLAAWLMARGLAPPEEAWAVAEDRIFKAIEADDIDAAATFAGLSMPGALQRLNEFRERAVAKLREKRTGRPWNTPAVRALRELWSKDAPEVLRELDR